ncbi:unnamed protein product, partial [Gulo gulo]
GGARRGRASGRTETWRSGPAVHLDLEDRLRPGFDAPPAASTAPVAASRGIRGRCHYLPARLEPSARPGPGPGRDLWRMTAESPEGGEGLCHPGHPFIVSFFRCGGGWEIPTCLGSPPHTLTTPVTTW